VDVWCYNSVLEITWWVFVAHKEYKEINKNLKRLLFAARVWGGGAEFW
jgi:hypothetical protein